MHEAIINNVKINLFTLGTWSDHAISQDDYLKNWKLAKRPPGVVQTSRYRAGSYTTSRFIAHMIGELMVS